MDYRKGDCIHYKCCAYLRAQQLGRAIKTIVSSACCMLISSGLLTKFWAESCRNAVLVQNASSTKLNNFISASEKWNGEKPYVFKLRTFRC